MAANVKTGRTRIVRYCGVEYTMFPSEHPDAITGKKQVWGVMADRTIIHAWVISRSRCVYYIHQHAVEAGGCPANLEDGLSYEKLVNALCN